MIAKSQIFDIQLPVDKRLKPLWLALVESCSISDICRIAIALSAQHTLGKLRFFCRVAKALSIYEAKRKSATPYITFDHGWGLQVAVVETAAREAYRGNVMMHIDILVFASTTSTGGCAAKLPVGREAVNRQEYQISYGAFMSTDAKNRAGKFNRACL